MRRLVFLLAQSLNFLNQKSLIELEHIAQDDLLF